MQTFCTMCGSQRQASAKFCAACGAPAETASNVAAVPTAVYASSTPYALQTPNAQKEKSSPNFWLIIIVIAFELIGDNLASHGGAANISVALWTVASALGIYLISTRSVLNKIVGAVKVLMYVVWIGGLIATAASNHLSGTYTDSSGLVSMNFSPNGQFSMSGAGISAMYGAYQVSGNTLTLDPPGSAGSTPNGASDPTGAAVYQMFQAALTASISSDRRTIDYAGQELTKQ